MLIFMLVLHIFTYLFIYLFIYKDVSEECLCGLLFVLYRSEFFRVATFHTNHSGVCKSFQINTDSPTKWMVQGHTIHVTAI